MGVCVLSTASCYLRRESLGVAREHAGFADVGQPQEEHYNPLEPNSAAGVWHGAVLERVDVGVDRREVDALRGSAFEKHLFLYIQEVRGYKGDQRKGYSFSHYIHITVYNNSNNNNNTAKDT